MIFTSPRFLAFLLVLLVLMALVQRREANKRLLTLASCFFYAAWDWRYLGLLLAVSVVDFVAANKIVAARSPVFKKRWLAMSIVSNLGVLGYFKYNNFFIENFNALTSWFGFTIPMANILLPAGISFYTFKTMSYTIDVYRGELEVCRSWLDYAMFITFFPELIAGPIVRGSIFLPQMQRRIGPTFERLISGSSLFLLGVIKKLFIADRLSGIADTFFASPDLFDAASTWCGVLAYTLQIYCDFAGYSDMAIGVARMIGYDLPENFRMPYLSGSITEFWRRWHMTLSSWLRDYLYIPLGGSRHGVLKTYRNLFLTMLLGGLWHGASWNFVFWGGLHGCALAGHKLWTRWSGGKWSVPRLPAWLLTFTFVVLCWVPFRSRSFADTLTIFRSLAGFGPGHYQFLPVWLFRCLVLCILGHLLGYLWFERSADLPPGRASTWLLRSLGLRIENNPVSGTFVVPGQVTVCGVYSLVFILLMLFFFAPLNTSPFIYFQF
ncbi:MAG TPA: MBOAT family O-acyltransferase [Verrucomicrobiae bacterium]|nr:MBOAT family O-acyltransferase [Verrucomicrobiae bacterium]